MRHSGSTSKINSSVPLPLYEHPLQQQQQRQGAPGQHAPPPPPPSLAQQNPALAMLGYVPAVPLLSKRVIGRSAVYCNGCCVLPRNGLTSLIVAALVIAPSVVFLSTIRRDWISLVVVITLMVVSLILLWFAVAIDPGIIPPIPPDPTRTSQFVTINNVVIECKVCPTCNIVRPPRSGHCFNCDYCVEEFDHHCGVLGSCVAKRTFRFFAMFFYATTPLAGYIFAFCIYTLVTDGVAAAFDQGSNFDRWRMVASLFLSFYTCYLGLVVAGQACMYTVLSCENSTQKEGIMRTKQTSQYRDSAGRQLDSPFDRGCVCNFFLRLCGPLGRSNLTPEHLAGETVSYV